MSKIGGKPIILKPETSIVKEGNKVIVKGPLGEISINQSQGLEVELKENEVLVKRFSEDKKVKAMHGTLARLLENAVEGTTNGFFKTLEIVGTGYWAKMEGDDLVLALGFSHQVRFPVPKGVKIEVKDNNKVKVFGIDKERVGTIADKIKRFKKPDSYKGKGIRYLGEKLRLKPGKAAAKTTVTK